MGLCWQAVWRGGNIMGWVPCGTPNTSPNSLPSPTSLPASTVAQTCPAPTPDPIPGLLDPASIAIQSVCPDCWLLGGFGRGVVTFGHGARHLAGTGLSRSAVQGAIRSDIQSINASLTPGAGFWGRTTVQGTTIEYRAMPLPGGTVNVGTYYIP
jgi:hypothetical protein